MLDKNKLHKEITTIVGTMLDCYDGEKLSRPVDLERTQKRYLGQLDSPELIVHDYFPMVVNNMVARIMVAIDEAESKNPHQLLDRGYVDK